MTDQTQQATADFHALAGAVLDELLERHPEWATILGDHRFDDRLADLGPAGAGEELAWAARRLADLDAVDTDALDAPERVDAALLHNQLLDRHVRARGAARDLLGPAGRQPRHLRLHAAGPRLRPAR